MFSLAEKLLLSQPGLTLIPQYHQLLVEIRTSKEHLNNLSHTDPVLRPVSVPEPVSDSLTATDSSLPDLDFPVAQPDSAPKHNTDPQPDCSTT